MELIEFPKEKNNKYKCYSFSMFSFLFGSLIGIHISYTNSPPYSNFLQTLLFNFLNFLSTAKICIEFVLCFMVLRIYAVYPYVSMDEKKKEY